MNLIYTSIPELLYLTNFVLIIVYFGIYTISKKYNYMISYKQNTLLSLLILLPIIILNINYPFHEAYLFEYSLYLNNYNNILKLITNFVTFLVIMLSYVYIKELKLNNFENNILILAIQLGVLTLLMSNNIILLYLSIELITITIYIIVALNKMSTYSIESGLKYFIVGAVSSGILLIGLSILYGTTGIININDLGTFMLYYSQSLYDDNLIDFYLIISCIFIIVSLLFKIYSAPFHLWISDIYQGSPIHVLAYISTVPSLAYSLVLIKFFEIFNHIYPMSSIVLFFSLISIFLGSLGALLQKKLKRLLAYSSIVHVGYFLLALSIYLTDNTLGIFTFFFYYIMYLANLTHLFSSILQNIVYKTRYYKYSLDQLTDYKGFYKQNSLYIVTLAIVLLSIAGIPPFIGFFGKLYILTSMISSNYTLFVQIFFILLAVVSCYYYLNIIKNIYFNKLKSFLFINYNITNNIIITFSSYLLILFIFYMNNITIVIYNIVISYII